MNKASWQICASMVLVGCAEAAATPPVPESAAVTVHTADVVRRAPQRSVTRVGVLIDDGTRELGFPIGGVIRQIRVRDGERVRRGQVLATLDPQAVRATVDQAEAGLTRAERELGRVSRLQAGGAVGSQLVDDASTARDVAAASLSAARFQLRYSTLVAPGDGTVLVRLADAGETVGAGMPVLALALTSSGKRIRVALTDREIIAIRQGSRATVSVDAFEGTHFAAVVTQVPVSPNRQNGLFDVELTSSELEAAHPNLPSGLVVRAQITLAETSVEPMAFVPSSALVDLDGQRAFVFAVSPSPASGDQTQQAERHQVVVSHVEGDLVAVADGLQNVPQIVSVGAGYLRPGSRVRVVQ